MITGTGCNLFWTCVMYQCEFNPLLACL